MPCAKHTQLKETIDRLERDGIIASVDKPTDRVHNLVITEKRNGALRICLDPRPLKQAISVNGTSRAGKSTKFMYLSKSTSNSEKSYSSRSKSTPKKLYLKYK